MKIYETTDTNPTKVYSKEEVDAQFGLAKSVLSLPNEEKQKYRAALEQGNYNGWKPAGIRNLVPGVYPQQADRAHPEVVEEYIQSIERFSRHIHDNIVRRLLTIFAIALGLDYEEWLVKKHRYEQTSGDHLRYMKCYARNQKENDKLGGHSDTGSLTLVVRQPVAALQVLTKSGEWKYVKPQMEALTVNVADALQFMTIVAPPKDQTHIDRLGVLYMVRIEEDSDLAPIRESLVLQKHGLVDNKILGSDGQPLKAGEWVKQRVIKNLDESTETEGDNEVNDVEIWKGVKVTYYD
ncbi:uncharacterized protein BDV17DRAFT_280558 [Aspergillus undulatus]|uniref:uncharacterized protein n=1 Tax=Aspergillus undulatus TaxID=1810928 RepID=UPI003CCDD0D0